MSFLFTAALALAVFVAVPVAAHLLRRGRANEREFPPALLVPPAPPVARRRSRLEDLLLLVVRSLLLIGLAVLGAVPFVRCSRLSLAREAGASVALAIVLDDSASMRLSTPGGGSRWERAVGAARELLRSSREGDAVAIVLAGAPARLALAATTDLAAARATLATVQVTDRDTDVANAVKLARSALVELPHVDRRVLVLSDLAGDELPAGAPLPWVPLPELAAPAPNCGVVRATRRGNRISAEIACSDHAPAAPRSLEVIAGAAAPAPSASASAGPHPSLGQVVGVAAVAAQPGVQTVVVELDEPLVELDVRLTGGDAARHDDFAPVAPESTGDTVGVLADPDSGAAATGGPPIVEQALRALDSGAVIRPLTLLPEDSASLAAFSALVLDDPAGLGPEARAAVVQWLERGGVALALLGPRVGEADLGDNLEPFVSSAVHWAKTTVPGLEPRSAAVLGSEAAGLSSLAPRGRVPLSGALPEGAEVLARWTDGEPFLGERELGRGLVVTAALPASPNQSDLALRPGFLALLAHCVEEAERRHGPRVSPAGTPWIFRGEAAVRITPPSGEPVELNPEHDPGVAALRAVYTPVERGRYRITRGTERETRIATLTAEELTRRPRDPTQAAGGVRTGGVTERVEVSREVGWLVLLAFAAEAALRIGTRWRERTRARATG